MGNKKLWGTICCAVVVILICNSKTIDCCSGGGNSPGDPDGGGGGDELVARSQLNVSTETQAEVTTQKEGSGGEGGAGRV